MRLRMLLGLIPAVVFGCAIDVAERESASSVREPLVAVLEATLVPGDAAPREEFSRSMAQDGDTLVIGAPGDSEAGQLAGSVFVFRRNTDPATATTPWLQQAKILPEEGLHFFGSAVALQGDTMLVGISGLYSTEVQRLRVYVRQSDAWAAQADLSLPAGSNWTVRHVALDGDTAAVITGANTTDTVVVFQRSGATWSQSALLTDIPMIGNCMGLDVDGDWIAVGAANQGTTGAVRMYSRAKGWAETAVLVPPDPKTVCFGSGVALRGDTLVIGAFGEQGPANAYRLIGGQWQHEGTLLGDPGDPSSFNASSVALHGEMALVGTGNGPTQGYLFTRTGSTWATTARLATSGGSRDEEVASSVVLGEGVATIAAPCDDFAGYCSGRAFSFSPGPEGWTEVGTVQAGGGVANSSLGGAVAVDDQTVVASVEPFFYRDVVGYAYTRGPAGWEPTALRPSVLPASSQTASGAAVAIQGETIAVSDPSRSTAWLFSRNGKTWVEQQAITDKSAGFGTAIAFGNSTLVVGAQGDINTAGTIIVYSKSASGWQAQSRLSSPQPAPSDRFGARLALKGTTLAVTCAQGDKGALHVFEGKDNAFAHVASFDPPCVGAYPPGPVAIDGDRIVTGCSLEAQSDVDPGIVFYARQDGAWKQEAALPGTKGANVALLGDRAAAGGGGVARVYGRSNEGWKDVTAIHGSLFDSFGWTVALSGSRLIAGAPGDSQASERAGAVHVYGLQLTEAACKDDSTVLDTNNNEKTCVPYLCKGGRCESTCAASTDCVTGFVCDTVASKCVSQTQTVEAGGSDGGCAMSRWGGAAWWPALVALLAMMRRRG